MRSGFRPYVLIKVLAPGFFAREDTKTPVKIAVVCLLANIAFVFALIQPLQHVGIALATVLSSWLNAGLLGYLLHRRGLFHLDQRLITRLPRILLAGLAMAFSIWLAIDFFERFMPDAAALALTIALGGGVFFICASLVHAFELGEVKAMMRRRS